MTNALALLLLAAQARDEAVQVSKAGFAVKLVHVGWVYPVLATGPEGPSKKPLAAGETRAFTVDVPESTDLDNIREGAMGARVTWVRPAP